MNYFMTHSLHKLSTVEVMLILLHVAVTATIKSFKNDEISYKHVSPSKHYTHHLPFSKIRNPSSHLPVLLMRAKY